MRSTPIFKILSAAVLAAVVVLLGVQTYRYFHRPLSVSAAYTSQVSDSISVTGWVGPAGDGSAGGFRHAAAPGAGGGKGPCGPNRGCVLRQ